EEELSFRHALVREAAYAMLTPEDRALGHRLAGEWLDDAGESEAVVLAEHFAVGGDRARARASYRRAAEQALRANVLDAAIARARGPRAVSRLSITSRTRSRGNRRSPPGSGSPARCARWSRATPAPIAITRVMQPMRSSARAIVAPHACSA